MRIPSQLNRESLYRPKNQRRRSTENFRRIIRLCLGLALVLLVMRQAAKPTVYQTFFDPSQTETVKSNDGPTGSPSAKSLQITKNQAEQRHYLLASEYFSGEDREIARELASSLLASDQQLWLQALLDWQSGKTAATRAIECRIATGSTQADRCQRQQWRTNKGDSFVAICDRHLAGHRTEGQRPEQ